MTALARYPRLQSHLIRLASSPLYPGRKVTDIAHAVRVLGFQSAVNASLVFAVSQMVPPSDALDRELWIRALTGAHLADRARRAVREDVREQIGEPFAPSLLRDLGLLVLRRTFPLEVARLDEERDFAGSPCELEQAVFGLTHEHVNGILCHAASIPDDIAQAMTAHHRVRPEASPLSALVHLVDCVAEQRREIHPNALRILGVGAREIVLLREALPEAAITATAWYEALLDSPNMSGKAHASGVFAAVDLPGAAPEGTPPPAVAPPLESLADPPASVCDAGEEKMGAQVAAFRAMAHVIAATGLRRADVDARAARALADHVLEAWARARPHLEAASKILPAPLLSPALRAGELALATRVVSAIEELTAAADGAQVESTATEVCEDLACAAAPLARRGLLDAKAFGDARAAMKDDVAASLETLATLFDASWDRVCGFTVVRKDEIGRARALAAEVRSVRDAAMLAEEALGIDQALARCAAALLESYDECRRVLTFVRWSERDVDAIAPVLAIDFG